MPELSSSLRALGAFDYSKFQGVDENSRMTLTGRTASESGKVSSNFLGRAFDCMKRSKSEIQENKDTAKAFVAKLKEAYGEEIGSALAKDLTGQINSGRPLTVFRIIETVQKAQAMAGKNTSHNEATLEDAMPKFLQSPDGRKVRVPDQEALEEALQQAFGNDVRFHSTKYESPEAMYDVFKGLAAKVVEREVARQMRPNTFGEVESSIGTGTAREAISKPLDGLPENDKQRFIAFEALMTEVQDRLTNTSSSLGPGSTVRDLENLHRMQALLQPGSNPGDSACLEDRVGEPPLTPEAAKRREAMMKDMKAMAGMLEAELGPQVEAQQALSTQGVTLSHLKAMEPLGLDPVKLAAMLPVDDADPLDGQDSILKVLKDLSQVSTDARANNWGAIMDDDPATVLNDLEAHVKLLDEIEDPTPEQEVVITALRKECKALIQDIAWAAEAMAGGFTSGDLAEARKLGVMDFGTFAARFTSQEIGVIHNTPGMNIEKAMQYKQLGLPIAPHTMVRDFTPDRMVGDPVPMGSSEDGPMRATFQPPTGGPRDVVMRKVTGTETPNGSGTELGIPPRDSHMIARGLAVGQLDQRLGFNLVPRTQVYVDGDDVNVAMEFVPGARGSRLEEVDLLTSEEPRHVELREELQLQRAILSDEDYLDLLISHDVTPTLDGSLTLTEEQHTALNFEDPGLRRDLVKLQLLDIISGQGDRHSGNYIVQRSTTGAYQGLKAIDNNQCLGGKPTNPNDLLGLRPGAEQVTVDGEPHGSEGLHGVLLPRVVDLDMARAVLAIEPRDLDTDLQGMTPDEISAAKQRLQALKDHISSGPPKCTVIAADKWGDPSIKDLIMDPDHSYVGRDSSLQAGSVTVPYEDVVVRS